MTDFPEYSIGRDPYNFEDAYVNLADIRSIGDSIMSGVGLDDIERELFKDRTYIPEKTFIERIKKLREKHPENLDCLEDMHKKAYPKDQKSRTLKEVKDETGTTN